MLLYNRDKTRAVKLERLRSFAILEFEGAFRLLGYFNGTEAFLFGRYSNMVEAQAALDEIYRLINEPKESEG